MFENVSFFGARGATLSLILLAYSAVTAAEVSEAEIGSSVAEVGAVTEETRVASDDRWKENRRKENRFSFPRWPERGLPKREVIPPPPPGPYMSTALNRFSLEGPAFDRPEISRPPRRNIAALETADTRTPEFSPDMPWPGGPGSNNSTPLKRWEPQKGYHFVDESEKPGSAVPAYYRQPQYVHGYQHPAPSFMGWSGNNWAPSMYSRPSYNGPYGLMPGRYYSKQPYQQRQGEVAGQPGGTAAPAK
jgi:hypothetical protein